MRPLIKYLLSLCILLLSGYGELSAHAYKESTFDSSSKHHKVLEWANVGSIQYYLDFIIRSSSSRAEKSFKIDVAENEVEEDELIVSKKHIGSAGYPTSIFFAQIPGHFFRGSKRVLSFGYLSYTSSNQYLIFQVFRI